MAGDRFILDPSIRALLRDLGIPAGRLLRRAQLPAGLFRGRPVALAPEEYFRFWAALDAEGQDPSLAVAIGQAISVEMFSPPLFAALCSPNAEVAARPFLTENEPMWRFFAPELRSRLADLHAAASAAERVRAALLETLPAGDHTMTTVARHLATSPRTLQRQLQDEGTTFQAVLTGTREHLARHYLARSAMTTAEIAYCSRSLKTRM